MSAAICDPIKVLLIEDNPGDALLLRELLLEASGSQLELAHADRLSIGLQRLEAGGIDAILLDLSLPDSTGLASFHSVQSHAPQVPIVVLTGLNDETIALQAMQIGAQDYLIKGQMDGSGLARALRYAIERQHVRTQLEATTQALRDSEARLAGVIGSAMDAIITIDAEQRITLFNAAAEQMFRCSATEVLGTSIDRFIPQGLREAHRTHICHFGATGVTNRTMGHLGTISGLRADGEAFPIEASISQIETAGEKVYTVILRDITERVHAEQALRQKTTFIQVLQDVAVAANQATSIDAALQIAIDQICSRIGWPVGHAYIAHDDEPHVLISSDIWYLAEPSRFATFRTITEAILHAPLDDLPGLVMVSGRPEWFADMAMASSLTRAKVISDLGVRSGFAFPVLVGAEVAAVLEFFSSDAIKLDAELLDVMQHVGTQLGRAVERSRAEAELRKSEERFRRYFELGLIGMAITSPAKGMLEVNDQICAILGYKRSELLQLSWAELTHPDDLPGDVAQFNRVLAGEIDGYSLDKRWIRKGGQIIHTTISVKCLRRADGSVDYFVALVQDITERRQAEEQLRRLSRAVEQSANTIVITDTRGYIEYANPNLTHTTGYTVTEALGQHTRIFKSGYTSPEAYRQLWETITCGKEWRGEFRNKKKNGELYWESAVISPIKNAEGAITSFLAVKEDITARKRAEEDLRVAEARYRTLVEQIPAIIYTANIDATSSTHYVSPQIEPILGFTPAEWLADPELWLNQVHPDDRAGLVAGIAQAQASDTAVPAEFRALTRDGHMVWLQDTARVVRDAAGQPLLMQGIMLDITERKAAEAALLARERYFRALIEHSAGGIVLFGADGTILYGSPATNRILGYTSQEYVGRNAFDLIHPEDCPRIAQQLADLVRRPGAASRMEARIQCADGSWLILEGMFTNLLDDPAVGAIVNNFHDITARKRAETALLEERALLAERVEERTADLSAANAELARAARLKDEFLASMSHELRTPLNAVLGLSEALQEEIYGALNQQQRTSLQSIEESGRHLLALINDILDLAKIGAGKLELEIEPVEMSTICQASLRLVKQAAQKKQLAVESTLDPAVTLLYADGRRLKQVLVNLLSNAVKFTPNGGAIGLEVQGDTTRKIVDLTVWDTGIGIAPEDLSRLFQPFVQLDSRLSRQYNGTGLGLTLVSRMAELHGGSVSVESRPGAGSRFTVSLPWQIPSDRADAHESQSPPAANEHPAVPTPATILLAEDNETSIATITDYLEAKGYRMLVARNGAEAIDCAHEDHPDLILMDIQMPGIDGLEATRCIRADANLPMIPIVAITGLAMPGDREKCIAAGANDYISKPISLKGLAAKIATYLQHAS